MRARNAATVTESAPASAAQDARQIEVLIDQSREAITRAATDGDLDDAAASALQNELNAAATRISDGDLRAGANDLLGVCNALAAAEGGAGDES